MRLNLMDSGGHTLHIFSQQHHWSLRDLLFMLLVFSSAKAAGAIQCKRGGMDRDPHHSCSNFTGDNMGDTNTSSKEQELSVTSNIRANKRDACHKPTQKVP